MLNCVVAIWILDDLLDMREHLSQYLIALVTVLVFSHEILQDTKSILVVDDLNEIIKNVVKNEV